MVYKETNIGSAKPSANTLKKFPHHLVNIRSLKQIYSVAEFCKDSHRIIEEVHSRKKIPIFVGGSMMYFKSLLNGISQLPERDDSYREELSFKNKQEPGYLYNLLKTRDELYAKKIEPNDEKRIIRALEVIDKTGKLMSKHLDDKKGSGLQEKYEVLQLGINDENRELLHARIENRLEVMLDDGLLDEVRNIKQKYELKEGHPILRAVNYKQAFDYLDLHHDKKEFFNRALFASRQLAKRQVTWIRSWKNLHLFNINSQEEIERSVKNFL